MTKPVGQRVWDLPTRLFHWLVVALLGFSWWSAETHQMDLHRYSGITLCGLVLFRLIWGFIGTDTSRFGQFVRGPAAVIAYLRPSPGVRPAPRLGHNPLGGWSVLGLLGLLVVQIISGLLAVDIDGIESGPLSRFISFDAGRAAAAIHAASFNILLILSALHVGAIAYYLVVQRKNLVRAMVTGRQRWGDEADGGAVLVSRWRLLPALAVATAVSLWLLSQS